MNRNGQLIYVMGPSGAGKDSLLGFARERIGARAIFAHRYITRPVSADENHIALTIDEFAARSERGLFALQWGSHGLHYGIGIEIDAWLARGMTVVISGSREHAPVALSRYPEMHFVYIDASHAVLAARLAQRGRETAAQIEERLARRPVFALPHHASLARIDNSGLLAEAGQRLLDKISEKI